MAIQRDDETNSCHSYLVRFSHAILLKISSEEMRSSMLYRFVRFCEKRRRGLVAKGEEAQSQVY